ncbi:unnamed protein product [Boreogadus saida]
MSAWRWGGDRGCDEAIWSRWRPPTAKERGLPSARCGGGGTPAVCHMLPGNPVKVEEEALMSFSHQHLYCGLCRARLTANVCLTKKRLESFNSTTRRSRGRRTRGPQSFQPGHSMETVRDDEEVTGSNVRDDGEMPGAAVNRFTGVEGPSIFPVFYPQSQGDDTIALQ